jgi:glycosyltransferase involved in cell wall biosynthesis
MRIAYLMSRYPLVSEAFIKREIQGLRASGIDIVPFTVHRARTVDLLAADDIDEDGATQALLPVSAGTLIAAHARGLMHPLAYIRTLVHSMARRGRGAPKQFYYFSEAMILLRKLQLSDIQHVHVHFVRNAAEVAYLAHYFSRRAKGELRGYSVTVHGPTDFSNVDRWRMREKVEAACGVVAISYYARSQIMTQLMPDTSATVTVCPYGVTLPVLTRRVGSSPVRVLCVGRLVQAKAQSVLLEAVARLIAEDVTVSVTIVGDGPLRAFLDSEVLRLALGEYIRLAGACGSDEVASFYGDADIFCLPSFAEGLPVVLMEAMSYGLPVVATRIAGVPELVVHGESGLLVTPGRVEDLAAALRLLAIDAATRERLGRNARAVIESSFEHEEASRRLALALRAFHRNGG